MSKHINKIAVLLTAAMLTSIPYSAYAADKAKTVKADEVQVSADTENKKVSAAVKEETSESHIGWKKNSDGTYSLIDGKGNMIKCDWCKVGGKWYYFNENGIMQKGWIKSDGSWFCLDNNGNPKTGWTSDRGNWYHLNSDGAMETGWQAVDGSWYYFNSRGEMSTGWQKINSQWYYFDNSGKMLSNTVVDGCTLGEKGNWI